MDKKELNKAIEKTVLKMAMEPKNTEHYHELAKYYAMDNQYEKVISVYESLLELDPKDLQTLLNLGSIWFYAKEYKKALKYFNQAMLVNPSNYLVYYNLMQNLKTSQKRCISTTELLILILKTLKFIMRLLFCITILKIMLNLVHTTKKHFRSTLIT